MKYLLIALAALTLVTGCDVQQRTERDAEETYQKMKQADRQFERCHPSARDFTTRELQTGCDERWSTKWQTCPEECKPCTPAQRYDVEYQAAMDALRKITNQ